MTHLQVSPENRFQANDTVYKYSYSIKELINLEKYTFISKYKDVLNDVIDKNQMIVWFKETKRHKGQEYKQYIAQFK